MADEIQIITKLYSAKGGAFLGSHQNSSTLDMTGVDMGSGTQSIGTGADEVIDVPGDISGVRLLEIKNLEAEGGNYIELSNATGGSFAGGVFSRVNAGSSVLLQPPGAVYAKANTGAVLIDFRACEV